MRFFNRLILQTPESVELEFTLAGIGNRAYALVIDYIVLGCLCIVCLLGLGAIAFLVVDSGLIQAINGNKLGIWMLAIQMIVIFFIYVGYFVFFETVWQGQTPGKRFVKIRVIRDDGRLISLQQATLRALLRPIDDFLFLGAFLIMLSKSEKRLGDWAAGTLVIQEERPQVSTAFRVSEGTKELANQLQIESELSLLLPEDFATIREYLQRQQGMLPQARIELSRRLAYRIKDLIKLETVPPEVTPNLFLEAVYLAYLDYHQQSEK
jgi:uncharacterized RDD family membrane protein YckC